MQSAERVLQRKKNCVHYDALSFHAEFNKCVPVWIWFSHCTDVSISSRCFTVAPNFAKSCKSEIGSGLSLSWNPNRRWIRNHTTQLNHNFASLSFVGPKTWRKKGACTVKQPLEYMRYDPTPKPMTSTLLTGAIFILCGPLVECAHLWYRWAAAGFSCTFPNTSLWGEEGVWGSGQWVYLLPSKPNKQLSASTVLDL